MVCRLEASCFASSEDVLTGKITEHVDLIGLAKRGVRLGYTPDVLNGAGGFIMPSSANLARIIEKPRLS